MAYPNQLVSKFDGVDGIDMLKTSAWMVNDIKIKIVLKYYLENNDYRYATHGI